MNRGKRIPSPPGKGGTDKRWYEKTQILHLGNRSFTLIPLRDDELARHGVPFPASTIKSWRTNGKLPPRVIVKVSRFPFLVLEKWREFVDREYGLQLSMSPPVQDETV